MQQVKSQSICGCGLWTEGVLIDRPLATTARNDRLPPSGFVEVAAAAAAAGSLVENQREPRHVAFGCLYVLVDAAQQTCDTLLLATGLPSGTHIALHSGLTRCEMNLEFDEIQLI